MKQKRGTSKKKVKYGICPECKVREGDSSRKRLYQCPYCGRWFCKKHLEPRLSLTMEYIEGIKDPVVKDKVYKEWRKKDGHPCWEWTEKHLKDLEKERDKFVEFLDRIKEEEKKQNIQKPEIHMPPSHFKPPKPTYYIEEFTPFKHVPTRKKRVKFSFKPRSDGFTWFVFIISVISLFLPWFSVSIFGNLAIKGSWIGMFQEELEKMESIGFINYLHSSGRLTIALNVIPVVGLVLTFFGLLVDSRLQFIGSMFMVSSPLIVLYYLSQGINFLGIRVSFVSLLDYGFWIFLGASLTLAYNSGQYLNKNEILVSLLVFSIVTYFLIFSPSSLAFMNTKKETSTISMDMKSLIENTIKQYLKPQHSIWGTYRRSINDLTYNGPSFPSSFDGYEICAKGTYSCHYGTKEGENVNYLYCEPTWFSQHIFCFKKKIISNSGNIQKVEKGCVYSFVLDPKTLKVISIDIGAMDSQGEDLC